MFSLRPVEKDNDGRVSAEVFSRVFPWWTARSGNSPPREILPGCGFIASINDTPVAVAFMYLDATGSGVAMLGWMATNPEHAPSPALAALILCIHALEEHARELNYWTVMAVFNNPTILAILRSEGYRRGEDATTQLFKPL